MDGERVQSGYAEQREDSCSGEDRLDNVRLHHATQNKGQFKTRIVYFWSFLFNIFRLGLTTTKSVESETMHKGDYCT